MQLGRMNYLHRFRKASNRHDQTNAGPVQLSLMLVLTKFLLSTCHESQKFTSFHFQKFNATVTDQLRIEGDAKLVASASSIWLNLQNGSLTGQNYSCGALIYANKVQFRDSSNLMTPAAVASFQTSFTFSMKGKNSGGFAFMLMLNSSTTGAGGASMCLLRKPQNGSPSNHVFAVEFDTWKNLEYSDPSDNHVGVNINSMISNATFDFCQGVTGTPRCSYFVTETNFTAWVDYDAATQTLEVRVTKGAAGVAKPALALIRISHLDISQVVNDYMWVGFSGSQSLYQEIHQIQSWSFATGPFPTVAASTKHNSHVVTSTKSFIVPFVAGVSAVCVALIAAAFIGHRVVHGKWCEYTCVRVMPAQLPDLPNLTIHNSDDPEPDSKDFLLWPRAFGYTELCDATQGFSSERLLGEGGYGQVFKGTLGSTGYEVAVKRMIHDGAREFLAEVSVISQIRHRNLVQLFGWCRENQHLLLVYEYMPNGSLEKWLFDSTVLTWDQRRKILTGVAAAVAYLHEGWNQCILHRDIKANNVMLDEDFNAHIGDFGLARLLSHSQIARTTAMAGTVGYLAPELVQTGRATQQSDVYSFGILALEMACGRPVLDLSLPDADSVLLDCVWRAHEQGDVLRVADPRMESAFCGEGMRCMLRLGLLCCHPNPEERPDMRFAHQCLIEEVGAAAMPALPASRPRLQYCVTYGDSVCSGGDSGLHSGNVRAYASGTASSQSLCSRLRKLP